MPASVLDFPDIGTQDSRQLSRRVSEANSPRRTESAPPYLIEISARAISSKASPEHAVDSKLGRANFALLRTPWSPNKWDNLPKHRSWDSYRLQSLAEEASGFLSVSAASSIAAHGTDQAANSLLRFDQSEQLAATSTCLGVQLFSPLSGMDREDSPHHSDRQHGQQEHPTSSHDSMTMSGSPSPRIAGRHQLADPPSLASLSLGRDRSASPSMSQPSSSGRPAVGDPAPSARTPPANASSIPSQSPSHQHLQPADQNPPSGPPSAPPTQPPGQAQHAGKAPEQRASIEPSASSAPLEWRSQQQLARQQRRQGRQQGYQWWDLETYPQYGQPPPPPPTPQQQRPSMQWQPHRTQNGKQRALNLLPQHQQHMGMPPMGMGMYPNMMPYPVMPGMHPQGPMQQSMLMPNGYMMAYLPPVAPGNMPFYGPENGAHQGLPRPSSAYAQSAPFPPALGPEYAEYMQQMAQQQGVAPAQAASARQRDRPAASSSASNQAYGAAKGQARPERMENGFHRRSSSAISAASSATSADRDNRNRVVPDRRGDSATATNSSTGPRVRGADEASGSAADSEHMAEAAALLEQLKAKSRDQPFDLQDIKGYVYEFCRDQHGSRFIQQKLAEVSPAELMQLFDEVQPHVIALMQDVFGNYVIQKCFEHGSQDVLEALTGTIQGHVLALTLQMYGCRVIQKALEVLPLEQQRVVARELQGHVMRCVKDQNGNHVIQKSIERVQPTTEILSIVEDVQANVGPLSTHPYGCRVVQRVLEHCTIPEVKDHVRCEILRTTLPLASDQYGNYVIQHMLEHGPESARMEIVANLQGQFVQLSQHKFASNVVEKCLQYGQPDSRQAVIAEVLGGPEEVQGDGGHLQVLMKDQYANYVVQKMLEVCDDSQRQVLMSRITAHLLQLKKLTYGKHIVARVEKLLVAGNAAASQQEVQDTAAAQQQQHQQATDHSVSGVTDAPPASAEEA